MRRLIATMTLSLAVLSGCSVEPAAEGTVSVTLTGSAGGPVRPPGSLPVTVDDLAATRRGGADG